MTAEEGWTQRGRIGFQRDRPVLLLPSFWWSGQHELEFESPGWWQKPTRRAWCKQCAQCRVFKEVCKDFQKMQLGRWDKCLACKGGGRKTNPKPQQALIGMIFTNADPRYAGRLNDKQGGDTILTMERVKEAIAFPDPISFQYVYQHRQ